MYIFTGFVPQMQWETAEGWGPAGKALLGDVGTRGPVRKAAQGPECTCFPPAPELRIQATGYREGQASLSPPTNVY